MRKHIISASLLLLLAACQMQEEYVPVESGFTAVIEEFAGETRTSLNESNSVVWSENDLIAVFQGSTVADLFEVSAASAGKTTGSFKEVTSEGGGGFESGNEIPDNVAVYPYMEDLECASGMFSDEDAYVYKIVNVHYPSTQMYQESSFPDDAFVMVAVTSGVKDNKLRFRNASGALRLRIKGDATVKRISIEGNANEPLGGYAVLKAYRDGSAPELESFGTSYGAVILDCGNGVRLDEDTATEFIIALPPTDFENGFTVTIYPMEGEPDVRKTEKRNSVRRSRVLNMPEITFGVPDGPSAGDAVDLNADGQTANSYIISEAGTYRFAAVKGNSSESVGSVSEVEVLWESFGTDVTPSVGDLVKEVSYSDGDILFSTADNFRKGNAVIAAKDASGTILWSWHIWLTDEPEGQAYYKGAGTMMDRNLGATSAIPGDVGALGLLYQWGRKDPFLGSSDISSTIAESTGSWPSAVSSSSSSGTVEYAVKNPMTFIKYNSYNGDWYYTGSSSTDNTRWESEKTIYDPCPAGWRVPDGGAYGVWSKALGSSSYYYDTYDDSREGINFSGKFGSASPIWYPASGYRHIIDGSLLDVGYGGYYWSVTPDSYNAYFLYFNFDGFVDPLISSYRAYGLSVRCFKEDSSTPPTETPKEYVNLSAEGTANSYIVSQEGDYKFEAVKGNSYESVGDVASVEVLWESFGTDVTPSVGDLIKEVSYSDGYILFSTPSSFQEGNAVIAAKNSSGTILWSWHIWLTDEPEGQVYYNNAGTMMDRNLGATSAEPGDVGALGLLYQWGRKDPFLGSSDISNNTIAESTGSWPSAVSSSSSRGAVEYAVKNPITFITATSSSDYDWHYSSRNNKLWQSEKTIYDPCPAGWRVPDGGSNGVWSKALGSASSYSDTYDSSKEGINFSGRFGNASPIWYPASGFCSSNGGSLGGVSGYGFYWSVSPNSNYAFSLYFNLTGSVYPSNNSNRAIGQSVRCFKEDSSTPPTETPKEYVNLSAEGTANSYIVSQAGDFKFEAVKGNSSEPVGDVASVVVLWESFGTDETPSVGDLVKEVSYSDGYILFSTPSSFQEGNAVIAAKNSSGTILWSWHIWLTDEPEGQVYYNNAGTMMDRNLGATSAEPGEVGALGLLYQWGRKDPFLGSSNISSNAVAKSTGSWPSAVSSSSSRGTIEYAVKNPMTFITATSSSDYDWHYSSRNNRLWQSEKTIYDPCPAGWRVPDGGAYGVWSKALGSSSSYYDTYDDSREGINFSGRFGNASPIWYPASGYRYYNGGSLSNVGGYGFYWSVTPDSYYAYSLSFDYDGSVNPSNNLNLRAYGQSVRCLKEGSSTPPTETPKEYENLSAEGTANSYIVSQTGDYKFEAVKGNSSESVGDVASVELLWESFGTDVTPSVGDLIKEVSYSDGYILFSTAEDFREGNAVIAAKDASGTILWSWHIWLTDAPEEQVYYNNASTMMDRNLGATSAEPGEVGALGLLYQWGRKDPFLGSSNISNDAVAKSTGSWPSVVSSSSSRGTVEYTVKNPMTFITATSSSNYDWHYSSRNNKLWQSEKTIYDPCPAGWRVPDGGSNGVWSKALGSASYSDTYDSSKEGIDFSGRFGNASPIWYPASGYRKFNGGSLYYVGGSGNYWSVTPSRFSACSLCFLSSGSVDPSSNSTRVYGQSVRCLKEGSSTPPTETPKEYENLSAEGTANSYIVSQAGDYKFEAVKGNSSESVGDVASVEVLWESFGTSVKLSVGDLIKDVSYSDGYILFSTPSSFQEGNAVIAAKNSSGTILWSWHIWLTDEPEEQVYYNGAGTMMDRNLGATSAEPGEVGALGLLYQWGRKDPFLGSSNISSNTVPKNTGSWPYVVSSSSSRGTVEYAVKNPMTFITATSSSNYDWHYSSRNNKLWQSEKTIYDPCPVGWRVPDGGSNGVWSKALGSASSYSDTYDDSREGINFSGNFSSAFTIWYPASGYRYYYDGSLYYAGSIGFYWSCTPDSKYACDLYFSGSGSVDPSSSYSRAYGQSVRCLQE